MAGAFDPTDGPDLDDLAEAGAIAAAGAAHACLSCGAAVDGTYCGSCGQKNDDLRRSSLALARDFLQDTFGFDSRMWRTLGLLAAAPGTVPRDYAHGKRSRYTPPVRLFLVVSFLFFLTLALTKTMFIAIEISLKTDAEIAAEKKQLQEGLAQAGAEIPENALVEIEGQQADCPINIRTRFFVRPGDVKFDGDAWRQCAASIQQSVEVEAPDENGEARARAVLSRFLAGVTQAVEHPERVNGDINDWLARLIFLMAPILALLLALFIRGKDALLFDHLVLSLYMHAAGFAAVGLGLLAAMAKVPHAAPVAAGAIGLYFVIALKRAYRRGWIKTVWTAAVGGLLYLLILASAATAMVLNAVWLSGA
jgi:hypothetical protein